MSAPILVTTGRFGQQVLHSPDAHRPATSRSEDTDCYQRDASYSPEDPSFDSLDRSSTDVNDVFEEEEVECDRPEESSPTLSQRIAAQLEDFLSDHSLSEHPFLLKHVQKGRMGYVSLKLLTSFKKIRELTRDWRTTLAAARSSANLEVNQEGTKVRRLQPLPNWLQAEPTSKLLLVWNLLPQGQEDLQEDEDDDDEGRREQQDLMELALRVLGCHGSMASLRVVRAGQAVPTRLQRFAKCISAPVGKQPCVLVEYQHLDGARRAWRALGGGQGPDGVRVAMLRGRWPGDSFSQEPEDAVCDGVCGGGACVQGMAPRKALRRSKRLGCRLEDSALCSESSESDFPPASPRPQRRVPRPQALYGCPLVAPHPSCLQPPSNPYRNPASSPSSSPLLPRKLFFSLSHTHSPLATSPLSSSPASSGVGTLKSHSSGDYSSQVSAGQARTGSWPQRWRKSQTQAFFPERSGAGFTPSGSPQARTAMLKVVRQPLGPDGTKGFYNCLGRGRILLQP
ncbi:la-related protein 6b [Aplochiton taeniatus]